MATYFGTSINESPTIVFPAAADMTTVQGLAMAINGGKLELPEAGANVIGIALFTNNERVRAGDDITVQIKDIGKWVAGEEIAIGDELTTNAEGKAVVAASGDFITAIAISEATEDGDVIQVQIVKAGYSTGANSGSSD